MSNIMQALSDINILDELSQKRTAIHRIHPLAKLLTTLFYLVTVVSFDRYEVSRLLPFVFYPVVVLALAELPTAPLLKRVLFAGPFILGVGLLSPLFDHQVFMIAGYAVSLGWITFISIILKCVMTVAAALILIATTGMDKLAWALRMLKVPRLLVLQLILTYRYISVLMGEAGRLWNAYMLRAPGQKGVSARVWGTMAGQLLIRTYDRAQRVYQAMKLRGFNGEYCPGGIKRFTAGDFIYISCWTAFFAACRYINLPALLGAVVTGVG